MAAIGVKKRTPWGNWCALARGKGFQVKRLEVKPGHRFSLQWHRIRSEHWVIVSGTGRVTVGSRSHKVRVGQHFFIPKRAKHRVYNVGRSPLVLIEVQQGTYLGEDDIVRLQDDYGRSR